MSQDDVIEEALECFAKCESVNDLVNAGADLFSIDYIRTVHKKCWPAFSSRLQELGNSQGKSVIIFDVSAIHYASWAKGEGVDGAWDRMNDIEGKFDCDHKFYAVDSAKLNRHEMCIGYKKSRDDKEPGLLENREKLIESIGNAVVMADGWEADDCMASIAFRAKLRKQACTIVTDDKDLWQTLGSGVTMYSPRKHEFQSEDWLRAKHKITPRQVVDWLCMVGKDDVPSCSSVGPDTASKLLCKYGSFLGIMDHVDSLTGSKREKVTEFAQKDYWLARSLHTLKRNLEFHW